MLRITAALQAFGKPLGKMNRLRTDISGGEIEKMARLRPNKHDPKP